MARADKAGGRARQNGLDRPGAGKAGGNQRTVAPHDHQRGRDAARLQKALGRGDQAVDHRDEAGIKQRRQGAARTAELGGELMARRHRQAGLLADQVARRDLMRRVAHREIGADRETGDGCAELGQGRLQRLQMQRMRIAMHIVAPGAKDHRIGPERRPEAIASEIGLGEADHDQSHAAALPLDQRVGGKRGRHRNQLDRRRIDAGLFQHRIDRA